MMNCAFLPSAKPATVVGLVMLDSRTNRFPPISDVSALPFKHKRNCFARSCSFHVGLDGKKITEWGLPLWTVLIER